MLRRKGLMVFMGAADLLQRIGWSMAISRETGSKRSFTERPGAKSASFTGLIGATSSVS
ncbi:hypothetical protein D3C71_1717810 [compost metagenome]